MRDLKINNGIMDYGFELNNNLIFDIGLNVGNKSEIFLERGAKVIGFEPQEDCFNEAVKKLSRFKNFQAENIALSKDEGECEIYISNSHTLTSMSQEFINTVKNGRFNGVGWRFFPEVIYTSTIDKMIEKYGKPIYIKIDVEGYEYEVLQGLSQKINYISIEYTPELYKNSEKCIDYLHNISHGNCKFNYVYRENDHYMFNDWLTIYEIKNYLSNVNDFIYEFGDIFIRMEME